MFNENQHSDVSRRKFFKAGKKIGAGLVAFIPALSLLIKDVPTTQAAKLSSPVGRIELSPNIKVCQVKTSCQPNDGCAPCGAQYDANLLAHGIYYACNCCCG